MKRKAICALIAAILFIIPVCGVQFGDSQEEISPAIEIIKKKTKKTKTARPAGESRFNGEDFYEMFPKNATHIKIEALPEAGKLEINGIEAQTGNVIDIKDAEGLVFRAGNKDAETSVKFSAASGNKTYSAECIIIIGEGLYSPDAEDRAFRTYRDAAALLCLTDGDENLIPEITCNAKNGVIELSDNGSVIYRPKTGFEGTDSFKFRLVDKNGLKSKEAEATVKVESPYRDVFFSDIADSPLQKEAIDLVKFTDFEIEKDENGLYVFDAGRSLNSSEAQSVIASLCVSQAEPNSDEAVYLVTDETVSRELLAHIVSSAVNKNSEKPKRLIDRILDMF